MIIFAPIRIFKTTPGSPLSIPLNLPGKIDPPRQKWVDSFQWSPPGANLLGDLLFVRTFSPTLDDGRVFESHDVEREIQKTPRDCRRIRRAMDRTSYASPTSGTHHVRVSGRRTRVSPSYIAFADRQHEVLPLPERYSRARARSSCHLFFWGPQPSVQSICVRKLIEEEKEEEKHICTGIQSCRFCHSRSGRAVSSRVIAMRALDMQLKLLSPQERQVMITSNDVKMNHWLKSDF